MSSSSLIPPSPPPTNPWVCGGRVLGYFVTIALALCKNRCHIDYTTEQIHMTYWILISRVQCWLPKQISFRRYVREMYLFFKNSVKVWHLDSTQIFLCIGLYCFISKIKLTQFQSLSKALFFSGKSPHCFPHPLHGRPLKEGWLSRTPPRFLHDEMTGQLVKWASGIFFLIEVNENRLVKI